MRLSAAAELAFGSAILGVAFCALQGGNFSGG